ncbi:battenin CLN3 protein [Imshaugia aleurites]|uniref:Protein BTN n=1 Tax=Imshaugia aleurites TaxID=172621 RepID=A0A8H3IWE7_9LECA|nr:battenin CLN3 protein [Imshaugia aleurites]
MLPLPGSPASSWAMYRARLAAIFSGADLRVCAAFWLFGLINNVLYVIVLSAALDLVGPSVPKAVVLLCDVIPSFLMKLCAPYFIHAIPYSVRVLLFSAFSAVGMLLIALTPSYTDGGTITTKMAGVVLASMSSGGGELSFISLTHFYGSFSLASWGSGTGGAGLIGAGAYALATTTLGLSSKTTIFASAFLPVIMLISFFLILPRKPMSRPAATASNNSEASLTGGDESDEGLDPHEAQEEEGLLSQSSNITDSKPFTMSRSQSWTATFLQNLRRSRSLFFPYMLPLLLVYIAEYTINQGVAPTLLFPLKDSPFKQYRAFYPTYNAIYQAGVFISRSSTPFFRIHNLYLPSLLQCLNLAILILQALFGFIPTVWIVFAIVFWEGLLGGAVYVNTFAEISDRVAKAEREFSLGAVTVSDSGGVCIAGFIGLALEVGLCNWQVSHGKDWCQQF